MSLKAEYLAALGSEIRHRTEGITFSSVYIGGGTPSLLSSDELGNLLHGLHLGAGAEVTVESNPEDVTPENLETWKGLSINRISVGIQSLQENEFLALGRRLSLQESERALERLARGWENWSVDLIAGMEGQTHETLGASLAAVLAHKPPHVSLYALETKPESLVCPQDPDDVADLLFAAWARLKNVGYVHYEISNFCLPGRECTHNMGYWHREEYIGCGVSAHSFIGNVRSWNHPILMDYIKAVGETRDPTLGREILDGASARWERFLLALRLREGIEDAGFASDVLQPMERDGWIHREGGRLRLSEKGMMMFNDVVLRLEQAGIDWNAARSPHTADR